MEKETEDMAEKKIIMIGGGIAGLSAGCYLQMNGYQTTIYELHEFPGGLCTSWKRAGYTFDGCIHWLVGSGPGDEFYKLWNELIDMKQLQIVDYEEFFRVEDENRQTLRVFADLDRLEDEMMRVAPEDSEIIRGFVGAARKCTGIRLPMDRAREVYSPFDSLKFFMKLLPLLRLYRKWGVMSAEQLAAKCKNPLLRKAILYMFHPRSSVLFLLMTLAWMHRRSAGYPVGGSLNFARLIERKYKELGGEMAYQSKVTRVVVEEDQAVGIMLEDGERYDADIVVSAADGHYTIFNMLDGNYVTEEIRDYYDNLEIFPSVVLVSIGVARTFENEPHALVFPLDRPLVIDETSKPNEMYCRIFNFDPTLAEKGKTCISAMFGTSNYEYWQNLRTNDSEKYKEEKSRIAEEVIEALERRFGGIKENVEVYDVATPATLNRYTNNWKGSIEGWLPTPKALVLRMKKDLPGLRNFYMIGQWVEPGGGLPPALMSGRNVAQIICKNDNKRFTVTKR
jgi:phytoene dehydrogenase-like protein